MEKIYCNQQINPEVDSFIQWMKLYVVLTNIKNPFLLSIILQNCLAFIIYSRCGLLLGHSILTCNSKCEFCTNTMLK